MLGTPEDAKVVESTGTANKEITNMSDMETAIKEHGWIYDTIPMEIPKEHGWTYDTIPTETLLAIMNVIEASDSGPITYNVMSNLAEPFTSLEVDLVIVYVNWIIRMESYLASKGDEWADDADGRWLNAYAKTDQGRRLLADMLQEVQLAVDQGCTQGQIRSRRDPRSVNDWLIGLHMATGLGHETGSSVDWALHDMLSHRSGHFLQPSPTQWARDHWVRVVWRGSKLPYSTALRELIKALE